MRPLDHTKKQLTTKQVTERVTEAIRQLRSQGIREWEILDAWAYLHKRNTPEGNKKFLALAEAANALSDIDTEE